MRDPIDTGMLPKVAKIDVCSPMGGDALENEQTTYTNMVVYRPTYVISRPIIFCCK